MFDLNIDVVVFAKKIKNLDVGVFAIRQDVVFILEIIDVDINNIHVKKT